jgi:hypothetical protein
LIASWQTLAQANFIVVARRNLASVFKVFVMQIEDSWMSVSNIQLEHLTTWLSALQPLSTTLKKGLSCNWSLSLWQLS